MKFAQKLRSTTGIYSQYVCYKTLKKLIKQIETNVAAPDTTEKKKKKDPSEIEVYASQLWWFDSTDKASVYAAETTSPHIVMFIHTLENEISRVNRLFTYKMHEMKDLLSDVYGRINGGFELGSIYNDIDNIAKELVRIDKFVRQSKLLFYKILKKYDKRNPGGQKASYWMLPRLEVYDFWNPSFDAMVVGVSDAYAEVRSLERQDSNQNREEVKVADDVETFERNTKKYFVRAEDIMLVKLMICKHLPLDIFGRKKAKKNMEFSSYLESLAPLQDATVTNSIYLDNADLTMYHERTGIETARGNLIRVRWYGDHVNPPKKVFIERKTRNPGQYEVDNSIKERFLLGEEYVLPYLKGHFNMEKKLESSIAKGKLKEDKAKKILLMSSDIQDEIVGKSLGPAVRTVCRRSAFQEGRDQTLRFSLDTNLHMIDETPAIMDDKWFRNLENSVKESEVVKFPFGVLEVKTQKDPPQWVTDLLTSGLVMSGERFSKFQYGTLKLRPKLVRYNPLWFEDTEAALTTLNNLTIDNSFSAITKNKSTASNKIISNSNSINLTLNQSQNFNNYSNPNSPLPESFVVRPNALSRSRSNQSQAKIKDFSPIKKRTSSSSSTAMNQIRKSGSRLDQEKDRDKDKIEILVEPNNESKELNKKTSISSISSDSSIDGMDSDTATTDSPFFSRIQMRDSFSEPSSNNKFSELVNLIPLDKSRDKKDKDGVRKRTVFEYDDEDEDKDKNKKSSPPKKIATLKGQGEVKGGGVGGTPVKPGSLKSGNVFKGSGKNSQRTAKTFFANERTLLQWVNTVTFLSLTGLTLLNTDTLAGRVAGISLIVVTIAFAMYAFRKYRIRLSGLEDSSMVGFEDKIGPMVLVIIFCVVLAFTGIFFILQDYVPSLQTTHTVATKMITSIHSAVNT